MKWKFKMQAFTFMPSKLIKSGYLSMTIKRWYGGLKTRNFSMILNDIRWGIRAEAKKIVALMIPPLTYEKVIKTYNCLMGKWVKK